MTATMTQVRAALQTKLATIADLNAYAEWPESIQFPAVIPMPQSGRYHESLGSGGYESLKLELLLLISPEQRGYQQGQSLVDPYLDVSGAQSVKAAVETDTTLGGLVAATVVTGFHDYGIQEMDAGIHYWGARLDVDIFP